MSSIVPRIPDGAPSDGTSTTMGPLGQVDETPEVDRVTVGSQEQRRRIHQFREQQEGVVIGADRWNPWRSAASEAPGECAEERLHPVLEVEVVVEQARPCASDGAPSSNSSVPRRLSTLSGVESVSRVAAEIPTCGVVIVTSLSLPIQPSPPSGRLIQIA